MNIVKIKAGDYTAKINLSRGANCISLKNTKYRVNILREPEQPERPENPYLYGMPILFPVNRIENGTFLFEGRQYRFPINEPKTNCHIHGYLHDAPFVVTEQGESFVRCQYVSDERYRFFPHKFCVEIFYALTESGLRQEVCIRNLSEENMPCFLGFHTTFHVPFVQDTSADAVRIFAQVGDEVERNTVSYVPTGKLLPGDAVSAELNAGCFAPAQSSISKHYKAAAEGRIELRDTEKQLKVVYSADEKFGWRLFFNGGRQDLICLEPQSCMVNCQNAEFDRAYAGFDFIAPNGHKKYVSYIRIEALL